MSIINIDKFNESKYINKILKYSQFSNQDLVKKIN
jgi:hypothetical protein